MQTIVELDEYLSASKKLISNEEREDLKTLLACDPKAGELITGTGGFRKLRVAREGAGKSGGYRLIYYYYNESIPIFFFTIYPKNKKDNLTSEQKNILKKLAASLNSYGE